jgi:2-methylcitrate dehydratase PrpD
VSASERIAAFVAGTESVPEDAALQAKRALLDTIGCALVGSREEAARVVAGWLGEGGGKPEAAVLGRRMRLSAPDVALANGTAAHALDFDDVSRPMRGHPSTVLVPALLALAEANGSSGREVLTAYVVGFEVCARVGRALGESHYARGWHATATAGTVGAAAAAARLLALDAERARNAVGIAASLASGVQANFGSMTKPLHAGWAARNGVTAARLAAGGLTSDAGALDGFLRAASDAPDHSALEGLGDPFEITASGIGVKRYPCCYATHRALDATVDLRYTHSLVPLEIEAVRVEVARGTLIPLRREPPTTGLEGKFSMEYCIAAALLDGPPGLAAFSDAAVQRPEARDLMARVTVVETDEPIEFPIGGRSEVVLTVRSGGEHRMTVDTPLGDPTRPLSWDDLAAKFRDCAAGVLPDEGIERAIAQLAELETMEDVRVLVEGLSETVDAPA